MGLKKLGDKLKYKSLLLDPLLVDSRGLPYFIYWKAFKSLLNSHVQNLILDRFKLHLGCG
ncbi:MAG: hypothetical protein K0S74_209 [Chlamydiales bacterium]|jgi:hypothetical protein|nr:hypothetical protein [Chlamydiales bacterium]